MTRRSSPNLTEQLAAALLQVANSPELYEHAKAMTAHQIVSLFHRDHHPVRVCDQEALAAAGIRYINHPCNLTWRLIAAHRRKTAEVDAPAIAKGKRIRKDPLIVGLEKMGFTRADDTFDKDTGRRMVTYSMSLKPKSRLRSRGFDNTRTRGMDGKVRPRKRKKDG